MTKTRLKKIVEILNEMNGVSVELDGDFLTVKFPYSRRAKIIFGSIESKLEIKIKWCKMCGCIEVVGKQKYCPKCIKSRRNKSQQKWRKKTKRADA